MIVRSNFPEALKTDGVKPEGNRKIASELSRAVKAANKSFHNKRRSK